MHLVRPSVASFASLLLLAAPLAALEPESQPSPAAAAQIALLMAEKAERTPTERKISSALLLELERRQVDSPLVALSSLVLASGVEADGGVLVDLDLDVTSSAADAPKVERLQTRVARLGGEIVSLHPRFGAVRVRLPLERIVDLAALDTVRSMRPADLYMTQVTTEGDVAHGADAARANFGVDGSGVGVGAMSDSVDALGDLQQSGELPGDVTVLAGQSGNPGTSEGTALLEIIHDMAPGADLFFATGAGGQAQMAQNILDLQAAGCDVIVDDVLYFTEPVFQDGIIAQAVDTVVAEGTIYTSSAGNSGNLNDGTSGVHEAQYSGTALPTVLGGAGLSAHDFGGGENTTTIEKDPPVLITLQWANPQDGADDDYDLYLLDSTLTNVIAASTNTQDGTQDPLELVSSQARDDVGNHLVVVQFAGDSAFIHLNTHRGEIEDGTDGQIFGHPAAVGAVAIAAVRVDEAGGGQFMAGPNVPVEEFSSDGPRRIFFEPDGTAVLAGEGLLGPSPEVRDKPDLTAANGVSTTTPGFETFFGTSASAPHSAAMFALLKSQFGSLDPNTVGDLFTSSALDIEDPGFDRDSGFGIQMGEEPLNAPIFADGFESGNTASWTN